MKPKTLMIFLLVLAMSIPAWGGTFADDAATSRQPRFSAPILIGGDDETAPRSSHATDIVFFRHPQTATGPANFSSQPSELTVDPFETVLIDDVASTPGAPFKSTMLLPNDPMLDRLAEPSGGPSGFSPNGIGPDAFSLTGLDDSPLGNVIYKILYRQAYRFQQDKSQNIKANKLALADVRNENELQEFDRLFELPDPVLSIFDQSGLGGNAQALLPYAPDNYPGSVVVTNPRFNFKWSACSADPICHTPDPIDEPYTDVPSLDMDTLGNSGIVAISYDPFNTSVYAQRGLSIERGGTSLSWWGSLRLPEGILSFNSPLIFYRRDNALSRYLFTGYTSFHWPHIIAKYDVSASPPHLTGNNLAYELWKVLAFNNPAWPSNTNPISVKAVDLGGAGRTDRFTETDLAVVYQTPLFALHEYTWTSIGRPKIFADGQPHRLGELLGVCDGNACSDDTFHPLLNPDGSNKGIFPDDRVSPVHFLAQTHVWRQGDYENMNPTDAFEPALLAFVGEGAYDSAVLKDILPSGEKKEVLVVPSGAQPVLYEIGPESSLLFGKSIVPVSPGTRNQYKPYGLTVLPAHILFEVAQIPARNMVPYRVQAGNLDGDNCEDMAMTWRGKFTNYHKEDSDTANSHYYFSDVLGDEGHICSNRVTLIYRSLEEASCAVRQIVPRDLGNAENVEVCSAAITDADGDGRMDVVAGNILPEELGDGKWSGFAYLLKGPDLIPLAAEKIRTGALAGDSRDGVWGPSVIAADNIDEPAKPFAQISGMPLMLRPIGCPDYNDPSDMTGQSVFETYQSIQYNLVSNLRGLGYPHVDSGKHPMPPMCSKREACKVQGEVTAASGLSERIDTYLPLFEDDECCQCGVSDDWEGPDGACYSTFCRYGLKVVGRYGFDTSLCRRLSSVCQARKSGKAFELIPSAYAQTITADDVGPLESVEPEKPAGTEEAQENTQEAGGILYLLLSSLARSQGQSISPEMKTDFIDPLDLELERIVVEDQGLLGVWAQPLFETISENKEMIALAIEGSGKDASDEKSGEVAPSCALVYDGMRMPRSKPMPGPRETTSIIYLKPRTCNPNHIVEPGFGEQCDTFGLSEAEAANQIATNCGGEAAAGRTPFNCDMRDCSCAYTQPACVDRPDAACRADTDCPTDQMCAVDCTCRAQEIVQEAQNVAEDDCECKCGSFVSEYQREKVEEFNRDIYRAATNFKDDLMCGEEGTVTCICRLAGTANLTTGKVLPNMTVQDGGSMFLDMTKMTFKQVMPVTQPIRIIPLDGASSGLSRSSELPDLSRDVDLAPLMDAQPLTNIVSDLPIERLPSGSVIYNNMIQFQEMAISPRESFSLTGTGGIGAQTVSSTALTGTTAGTAVGDGVYVTTLMLLPDCPTFKGVEGFKCDVNVDQPIDLEGIKSFLASKSGAGKKRSDILKDFPVGKTKDYKTYRFKLLSTTNDGNSKTVHNVILTYQTALGPQGGGCGCQFNSDPRVVGTLLSEILCFIAAAGGVALVRMSVRKNR